MANRDQVQGERAWEQFKELHTLADRTPHEMFLWGFMFGWEWRSNE